MTTFYTRYPTVTNNAGTVTSVDVSGGTTGLTTSGGPITTSGVITIDGVLNPAHGGTGSSSFTSNKLIYYNGTALVSEAASTVATSGTLLTLTGQAATDIPLKIVGASSPTADLQQWNNPTTGNIAGITASCLYYGGTFESSFKNTLNLSAFNVPGITVTLSDGAVYNVLSAANLTANDLNFQCVPKASTGYTFIESYASYGLALSAFDTASGLHGEILFTPQRIEKMRLSRDGFLGVGTASPTIRIVGATDDAVTATVTDILQLNHSSSGTPAASFGTGLLFTGESTTTDNRNMARIQAIWTTATDASRATSLQFQTVTAAGSLTTQMTIDGVGITTLVNNLILSVAGNGLSIKEGSNATMGTATLSGGTIVVSTNKVTANSRIFITVNGGTLTNVGSTYVSARSAGTSFTISSTNILDASNVAWLIVEPS